MGVAGQGGEGGGAVWQIWSREVCRQCIVQTQTASVEGQCS